MGADVHAWDINPDMRAKAAARIGNERVFEHVADVLKDSFDSVICNLVLCIVDEEVVGGILSDIRKALKPNGREYIGFCNPKLFNVPESQLDYRYPTGHRYADNHIYKKVKKEGGYEILAVHRPIQWYEEQYERAGLKLSETILTPEYKFDGRKLNDFASFTLSS